MDPIVILAVIIMAVVFTIFAFMSRYKIFGLFAVGAYLVLAVELQTSAGLVWLFVVLSLFMVLYSLGIIGGMKK